jgi:hypothetical protein
MRPRLLLTAATCLLLTACGGSGGDSSSSEEPLSQDTIRPGITAEDCDDPDAALTQAERVEYCAEPVPSGPPVNERGNLAAAFGQPVIVPAPDGQPLVEVTVDVITVDHPCDGPAVIREQPENGHFIGVALTVTAQPALAEYQSPFGGNAFAMTGPFGSGMSIIGADGFTEDGISSSYAAFTCSADSNDMIGLRVQPGQNYRGVAVLDSANTAGTLIWQPIVSSTEGENPPGFEWTFGDPTAATAPNPAGSGSSGTTGGAPSTPDECIGYGCSPEQDAEINEGEAEANQGY